MLMGGIVGSLLAFLISMYVKFLKFEGGHNAASAIFIAYLIIWAIGFILGGIVGIIIGYKKRDAPKAFLVAKIACIPILVLIIGGIIWLYFS